MRRYQPTEIFTPVHLGTDALLKTHSGSTDEPTKPNCDRQPVQDSLANSLGQYQRSSSDESLSLADNPVDGSAERHILDLGTRNHTLAGSAMPTQHGAVLSPSYQHYWC